MPSPLSHNQSSSVQNFDHNITLITLENGMRVIVKALDAVETISLNLFVPVGARHETPGESGISHMLEHMFFKGTPTMSAIELAETVEGLGAHMNAYTSHEATVFTYRALAENIEQIMAIQADVIQNASFDQDELTKERQVVLQEIAMTNDNPDHLIFDLFQETAFQDHPLGRPILGTVANVEGFSSKDLKTFKEKYYDPASLILGVSGKVDPHHIKALVEKNFASMPAATKAVPTPAKYTGGQHHVARDLEQVHYMLGFEGVPQKGRAYFETALLGTILGGGMSSKLFQEIREKQGLVYSIFAFHSAYSDTGLFGIHASMTPENLEKVHQSVLKELNHFAENLRDDDIKKARQQLKSSLMMSLESTTSQCDQAIQHLKLHGRPKSTAEILSEVNAVTKEGIIQRAQDIFKTPQTRVTLGPKSLSESV